jgi:hypothetical protein
MRALAAPYIVVHQAASSEAFHWYADPSRFASFQEGWTDNQGNSVYRLPPPDVDQAVVVDLSELSQLPKISSIRDMSFLTAYTTWAAGKKVAELRWLRADSAEIDTTLGVNEAVLLKVNYADGWKSSAGVLSRDPIGFILLRAQPGPHSFKVRFGSSWDDWIGISLTVITLSLLVIQGPRPFHMTVLVPALGAFFWLSLHPPPNLSVAEAAFRELQPPMISRAGIVDQTADSSPGFSPGHVISLYGNFRNVSSPAIVRVGDRLASILYRSAQVINFEWPRGVKRKDVVQVQVGDCRGNTFQVPAN